ncbi:MAG: hypothetical protein DRO11_06765 [Methanobacteriota archaeon]|nr:MAG: hypothetical protein DRO11_06765 [Euryarchaeota archaeon]
MVEFRCTPKELEVLLPNGETVRYRVEYRWDPLTSSLAIVCPYLKEKWISFYGVSDRDWLTRFVEESKKGCPFCEPMIDRVVARFPPRLGGGLLRFNNIYVFPNLYPRQDFEAVITSPNIHYLEPKEFSGKLLQDYLVAALRCVEKVFQADPNLVYPVIGCNYLHPAGASLTHFHLQVSMRGFPFSYVRRLLEASTRYFSVENKNFWSEFLDCNVEREIGWIGDVYWYTPFAPSGFCEVRALVDRANVLGLTEKDLEGLACGVSNVLRYYGDKGFSAFNLVIYSDGLNIKNKVIPVGLRIVARPNPGQRYVSIDSWYMPFLLGETVVLEKPEDLAKEIKTYF